MMRLRVTNVFKVNVLGEPLGDYFVRTIHDTDLLKTYPDIFCELFMKEAERLLKKDNKLKGYPVFQITWFKSDFEKYPHDNVETHFMLKENEI